MVEKSIQPPRVIDYSCYRGLIKDFYEYKKFLRPSFSFRQFSKKSGFASPNYIQLVIKGEKSITEASGQKVAEVLGLSPLETEYFLALIRFESCTGEKEHKEAQKWLLISAKKLMTKDIKAEQIKIFEKWYYLVIREMALMTNFKACPQDISQKSNGKISVDQAEEALDFLLKQGFLIEQEGKVVPQDVVIDSGDNIFCHKSIEQYHKSNWKMWIENIENFEPSSRDLGVLNIPLQKNKIPHLISKIHELQDEIIGMVQGEDQADCVVQFGTYLMPIVLNKKR